MLPCQGYTDKRWADNPKYIGYEAVGPGWKPLLEELDRRFQQVVGEKHSEIRILQIKEKFGTLRVYTDLSAFDEKTRSLLHIAITEVEIKSAETCEECGQPGYPKNRHQYGWIKTLCEEHHNAREAQA